MSDPLDCIAMREFPGGGASAGSCVLKLYRPIEHDGGRSFGCCYEVSIGGVVLKSQTLVGVDSIQALISALATAALEIELTSKRGVDWFIDDLMRIKT